MTRPRPDEWTARLDWILERSPDVAVAGATAVDGFLYRRRQLIARRDDLTTVLGAAGRSVVSIENLPVAGFSRIHLTGDADPIALTRDLAATHGRPVAEPNHVLRGEAVYPGGAAGTPVPLGDAPRLDSAEGTPAVRITLLDTGWIQHPWLRERAANVELDAAEAEDIADLADSARGGLAGHGLFAAGLLLQSCPEARIAPRRLLDAAGLCDEVQLAVALAALRDQPDVLLVAAGGYMMDDRLTALTAAGLAAVPPDTVVVAAAGNAGIDGRPFWPAAGAQVLAVAALDSRAALAPFSNRGSWVDVAALGTNLESSFAVVSRRASGVARVDSLARWSGTSFAAALVAGEIGTRMAAAGQPAAAAARQLMSESPLLKGPGRPIRTVLAPSARVRSAPSPWYPPVGGPAGGRPPEPGPSGYPHVAVPPPPTPREPLPEQPTTGAPYPGPVYPGPVYETPGATGPEHIPPVYSEPAYGRPRSRWPDLSGIRLPRPDLSGIRLPRPALPRRKRRARPHTVSTGFAAVETPEQPIPPRRALQPGTEYAYWFEIGDIPVPDAIDRGPGGVLPLREPPAGTPLTVVLYGFDGEIEIYPYAATGELMVQPDGSITVTRQPWTLGTVGGRRLYFPVRIPASAGTYRLRCNLYCRRTLLQSRLIQVRVGGRARTRALVSTVDYTVAEALDPAALATVDPLRLSAFLNDNGDGTHSFRFLGDRGLRGDAVLDAGMLQDDVDRARRAYRTVAWGDPEEWREGRRYAYATPPDRERLATDLIRLARAGYRLWTTVAGPLADATGGELDAEWSPVSELQALMRQPGAVEISSKHTARMVVPAAILYDYPLNPQLDLTVCPDALAVIGNGDGADLARHRCFRGYCPHYYRDAVVCPGGFWGFRHAVGLPQSSATTGKSKLGLIQEIRFAERPDFVIGATTDPEFRTLKTHLGWVRALGGGHSYLSEDHLALVELLRARPFEGHVVYFICHGALVDGVPALVVGAPGSPGITPELIADGRVYWPATRPLVVLNGCGTTALEPRYALNMVDAFVRRAGASGVIGTEITVFESLAVPFAEEFFGHFLASRLPLGEALRRARLTLLARGNPLGLVYIGYAAPQLRVALLAS